MITKSHEQLIPVLDNPLDYNSMDCVGRFNCGGFALQFLYWYMPDSWSSRWSDCVSDDEDLETLLCDCVEDIKKDFDDQFGGDLSLNEIPDPSAAPIGTEVIGFRFAYYENEYCESDSDDEIDRYELDDFHFIWRDPKGQWWDKPGGGDVKEFTDDIYEDWNGRYNGEIVWFAKETK